jgi:hypothetical protein
MGNQMDYVTRVSTWSGPGLHKTSSALDSKG